MISQQGNNLSISWKFPLMHQANILPAGLWHPTASGLFIILYVLGLLVLLLRLPRRTTEEISYAPLPGRRGARTHRISTCIFVLCWEKTKTKHHNIKFNIISSWPVLRWFHAVSGLVGTHQVWNTGCWSRRHWLNWSPETSGEQKLQQLQTQTHYDDWMCQK